ncbi:DNA polymerase I [Helicobacter trogontum]|uniref:DNA polymerase I n=1 Tax=Helicobacter trogontum TaxID=50960 RepID=A0A4U8SBD5_9HELI|nr:DNA polymerase I [Helicobacter trogontum]TLD83345.1 DNA polymerase I [Helicobacter trogontum]
MQTNNLEVILVDTFGFFFRSYYALPPLHNSKHFPTSLLTGFATLIFNLYKEHKNSCIIFTLEGSGINRRKEFYPQYKANRKEAPQDLLLQLPVAITWLEKMGLPTLSLQGYEADDCIATLATLAKKDGFNVQIISHDKDLYQLINDGIHIFDYAKKQPITQKECYEKFGVLPHDFIMYQSIVGDSSDNVPGIKGIGPKGAQNILTHFKSLETLYDTIEQDYERVVSLLGKRTAGLIKEHKDEAFISRTLVTLCTDLLQDYDFLSKKNEFESSPLLAIKDELESYELQRILQKILPKHTQHNNTQHTNNTPSIMDTKNLDSLKNTDKNTAATITDNCLDYKDFEARNYTKNNHATTTINLQANEVAQNLAEPTFHYTPHLITDSKELFELLESIPQEGLVAFDCETNGLDVRVADMVGFSFCFDMKNAYYVPFLHGGIQRERGLHTAKEQAQNLFNITSQTQLSLFDNVCTDENSQGTTHDNLDSKTSTLSTNSQQNLTSCVSHAKECKPSHLDSNKDFSLFSDTPCKSDLDSTHTNKTKQISQSDAKKALEILFKHQLVGHNIKFDLHIAWHNFGIKPTHIPHDSMLLAWLDDPSQSVSLDNLMKKHFNHTMIAFSDVVPKKATFDSIDIELASRYAAEDAAATLQLYYYLKNTLHSQLFQLAKDLEFPFIHTLCAMEDSGIAIDHTYFKNLKTTFSHTLQQLQQTIYEKAGVSFNLNSPKQVAEILFDTLKLDAKRKGKSGYSTDETTLLALKDSHPVIPLLLEYREVFKLFSTYIEPILKLGKNENRIYTTFLQTGTNTGRLSSKSPNLQNIPVRSEIGRSIRKGFVSRDGYKLLSLDYSQIELRLLAHFSCDKVLLESFHHNADIHAETAKLLFKDTQNKDFSLLRSIAKSINFGLIYGMGARKLSQTLSITQNEAKHYIENYFATFPSVKQFLESQKDAILTKGYSMTLLGRKRYFDFFNATEFMRANFLREGVNTIFQGSAADLIKLSMNEIYKQIVMLYNGNCSMLLQVHDELIFEVKEDIAESLAKKIKDIMENIYTLNVPLVCNLSIGNTWAELK